MQERRIQAALFANDTFYHSFNQRDLQAMDNLWGKASDLLCLHPGWRALHERSAIMESWSGILRNEDMPDVKHWQAQTSTFGDVIMVTCYEGIGDATLIACNGFTEEAGETKLVFHQSGQCAHAPPPAEDTPTAPIQ